MSPEQLNKDAKELKPQVLAERAMAAIAAAPAPTTPEQAVILEAAARFVAFMTGDRPEIPAHQVPTRSRLVMISPDKDTDYCYVDMSREEALEKFWSNEDAHLYKGVDLKVAEQEFVGGFMLWRNMGNGLAKMMRQNGFPPEIANLTGDPDA